MNTIANRAPSQPVVQPPSSTAIAAFQQHELVPRIQLARAFPRSMTEFRERLHGEVLEAPEGMVYWKPQTGAGNVKLVKNRRGEMVQQEHVLGPSVRLAEIAARLFTNLHLSKPELEEHDGRVTATVLALDLESNVSTPGVSSTSLVDSYGKRMSATVISNLVSATASKARRQAIFAIVGKALFDELVPLCLAAEERKLAAAQEAERKSGKGGELWAKHVAGWKKAGISEADLLKSCGVPIASDVTASMLVRLNAAVQSVKEGIPARVALGLEQPDAPPTDDQVNDYFAQQGEPENA